MRFFASFALVAGLLALGTPSAAQAPGQVVQEVVGTSNALDTFTSNSFTDSSLQATITPTSAGNLIEIHVIIPSADARRISGSVGERAYQVRVMNVTTGEKAIPAQVYGIELASPSSARQLMWLPTILYNRVPAGSTATQTFRVQMRAVYGAGQAETRLRADEEQARIILREVVPFNPVAYVFPEPVIDIDQWPQTWAGSEGFVVFPNMDHDAESGRYSVVFTMHGYGSGLDQIALGRVTATNLTQFGTAALLSSDVDGWIVGWEPDGNGGCIGAAYMLDHSRRGMSIVSSSDCASITGIAPAPTFTDDETSPVTAPYGVGDVNRVWKNPLDGKFYCFCRWFTGPNGRQSPSLAGSGRGVRAIDLYRFDGEDMTEESDWTHLGPVFWPDEHDKGITEFYGATAPILVAGRLVSFVRILRDDVGEGIGWSEIAVSDDGVSWHRERWPFIPRGASGNGWDAAMKWIGDVEIVGADLVGLTMDYDRGHKVGNRVIGAFTVPLKQLQALVSRLPG